MYWVDEDQKYHGVLNGFDLSVEVINGTPAHLPYLHQFTGTIPFMAIDLVRDAAKEDKAEQIIHLYRHDLESFLYVIAFLVDPKTYGLWLKTPLASQSPAKSDFLITAMPGAVSTMAKLVDPLRHIMGNAHSLRQVDLYSNPDAPLVLDAPELYNKFILVLDPTHQSGM